MLELLIASRQCLTKTRMDQKCNLLNKVSIKIN